MAYPTDSLGKTLEQIDQLLIRTKTYCQAQSSKFASGGNAHDIVAVRFNMKSAIGQLNTLKTAPGLAAYAQTEKNDGTLDVAAEFTATVAAMQAVVDNIESTFPADGDGYILREKWDPSGNDTIPRTFTAGALATLKGLLDAVVAQIN